MLAELEAVYVLSLASDTDRRSHIRAHFSDVGIEKYAFVNAATPESKSVKDLYRTGFVQGFPNCFRCKKESCACPNNILIPQQIANWVSFMAIWRKISTMTGPVLICEDDVYFYSGARDVLERIKPALLNVLNGGEALIRLGQSGNPLQPSQPLGTSALLTAKPYMSNVAHIITPSYARRLLHELKRIDCTSDVWAHKIVPSMRKSYCVSVEPLLATDLSYNPTHARFKSNIHPKGISASDNQRSAAHIKRVDSKTEYDRLFQEWIG